ncbi:hypothetical protein [Bacterioplanoides sp. SCSIO 12839]|uniref:hypothetical protein n=1 Tax=Bacterioplanoides sp. SCSIO 12839 TaxID=2829569 RepID=UPI00210364CB|nr:hypothetical protein [Bacterioplanoides sp. SCSIO 12839]UTW48073.1 hypothetical protein KFF03_16185 [Bacterioplanoides sp. SCSIO 12839]
MSMRTEHDLKLMQYAQGALLGEVAPSFRAVSFKLSKDGQDFAVRFIFDGEPSEDAREVANVALTNLLANYSQNHRSYKEEMLAVPYPEKMEHLPLLVYLRNEDDWNSWSKLY